MCCCQYKKRGGDKTNKRHMIVITALSGVFAVLAVTAAAAESSPSATPLYTVRMEQASSEMNFLPTDVNGFIYNTEKGCTVNYCAADTCGGGVQVLDTMPGVTFCDTCPPGCITIEWTCHGNYTCYYTCMGETCPITCAPTCPATCYTCQGQGWTCDATGCQDTCSTCDQPTCPNTCWDTCDDPTCPYTCERTCRYTCTKPCIP